MLCGSRTGKLKTGFDWCGLRVVLQRVMTIHPPINRRGQEIRRMCRSLVVLGSDEPVAERVDRLQR